MRFAVNGKECTTEAGELTPLLYVLREELGLVGVKAGCQVGSCGSCTVLINGEPRRSCLTPAGAMEGASIITAESLGDPRHLSAVQAAFDEHNAAQCGFCTPGMMLAATALIERKGGAVEREEVVEALGGHFCRCTGFVKIIDAVVAASRGQIGVRATTGLEFRRAGS